MMASLKNYYYSWRKMWSLSHYKQAIDRKRFVEIFVSELAFYLVTTIAVNLLMLFAVPRPIIVQLIIPILTLLNTASLLVFAISSMRRYRTIGLSTSLALLLFIGAIVTIKYATPLGQLIGILLLVAHLYVALHRATNNSQIV